jgi:hypothetical protein
MLLPHSPSPHTHDPRKHTCCEHFQSQPILHTLATYHALQLSHNLSKKHGNDLDASDLLSHAWRARSSRLRHADANSPTTPSQSFWAKHGHGHGYPSRHGPSRHDASRHDIKRPLRLHEHEPRHAHDAIISLPRAQRPKLHAHEQLIRTASSSPPQFLPRSLQLRRRQRSRTEQLTLPGPVRYVR